MTRFWWENNKYEEFPHSVGEARAENPAPPEAKVLIYTDHILRASVKSYLKNEHANVAETR